MNPLEQIAQACNGKIESVHGPLPDGSGFAIISMPLPKDHWLTTEGFNVPPMPFRFGCSEQDKDFSFRNREQFAEGIRAAARHAIRASTTNGKEMDFDPDALVMNMVTGMLGYHTDDGLSSDKWANP